VKVNKHGFGVAADQVAAFARPESKSIGSTALRAACLSQMQRKGIILGKRPLRVASAAPRCNPFSETAQDRRRLMIRDALYYPNIHIEDPTWLKATLFNFPHVLRMTPRDFVTEDNELVRQLAGMKGTREEPLVGRYDLNSYPAYQASNILLEKLEAEYPAQSQVKKGRQKLIRPPIFEQLSQERTKAEFGADNVYTIYQSKVSMTLSDFLMNAKLAWSPGRGRKYENWLALHPRLGEAIMSTIAAMVAKDAGLEIVTSSTPIHETVWTHDGPGIYDAIIHGKTSGMGRDEIVTRVGQLVLINHFDMSKLSADDIASMSRDGETLSDFRQQLSQKVDEMIPLMQDQNRLQSHMKQVVQKVVDEWSDSRASMSMFGKKFFGTGLLDKSEKAITGLIVAAATGAGFGAGVGAGATAAAGAGTAGLLSPVLTTAAIGLAPGLAVGLIVYGVKTWSDMKKAEAESPYRLLTKIHKLKDNAASSTLIASAPLLV
jgi:hypothetical protein